jgi:thiol-disulfide isomerase/thioredoxin
MKRLGGIGFYIFGIIQEVRMVKKKAGLALMGLISLSLVLTACGQAESDKELVLITSTPETATVSAGKTATTTQAVATPSSNLTPTVKSANSKSEKVAVGYTAPDFTLKNLDGEAVSLSQFRGKFVLINFWATWCGPCREELALLSDTYKANKDRFVILGVDVGEEDVLVRLKVKEVGITYPTVLDSNSKITMMYKVTGYPTSIFVDKDGIIQTIKVGAFTQASLKPYLDKILK